MAVSQTINSAIGEALSAPIFLLDDCERVSYANRAADELLDGRFGLKLKDGSLVIADTGLRSRLASAIGDLASGKNRWAVLSILPSGKLPGAVLHLARAEAGTGEDHQSDRVVAVLSVARALEGQHLLRVRQHFGLSKTEAEITALLVGGHTPREIAERRRSTEQTIRWHVKNIHAKTYTRRLTELVLLVQNVRSPFTPVTAF